MYDSTRTLVVDTWNSTHVDYELNHATLASLFQNAVVKDPDAIAIIADEQHTSYRQLDQRSNQLARYIQQQDIGPDDIVAVLMDRSLDMVESLYAIIKAGAAYLPLDPDHPPDRLAFIVKEARVKLVLCQQKLLQAVPPGPERFAVDAENALLSTFDNSVPECPARPHNLAYVIYTSGSTGKPKGVMNEHRGICNRLAWMQDAFGLTTADKIIQKTPYTFDVSVWEFFWPLLNGAQLILLPPGAHRDAGRLVDFIAEQQITFAHFVPSMLQLFLNTAKAALCPSLKYVICSGEALPAPLAQRFLKQMSARLYNLYGPTEAAVDVSAWQCSAENPHSFVPIGKPIANTSLYILNEKLEPLPVGEHGELYIGGVQVARGYLNQPQLTTERFIDDPFSTVPGSRLYKTGDLAYHLSDGNIVYLGRNDSQIKLRGQRVELGEIENALLAFPEIAQAAVMVHESDAEKIQELVAYVACSGSQQVNVSNLRRKLQQLLPEYMLPQRFVATNSLPLTANGKLDRKALQKLGDAEKTASAATTGGRVRPVIDQEYVEPKSALERYLRDLWCDVLEIERIGIHDRFFELGGSSLQAAMLVERLQRDLATNVFVVTLFDAPTIAQYAEFLQREYRDALMDKLGLKLTEDAKKSSSEDAVLQLADFETFRRCIPSHLPGGDLKEGGERCAKAFFILAPPRSGTSLLRLMLAGHSQLHTGNEFQLLHFANMQDRRKAYSGKFSLWLEGLVRTVMDIKDYDVEQAKRLVEKFERNNTSTKAMYAQLQQWVNCKTLVDKSPSYALDQAALRKAECDFNDACYIHLVRHPHAVAASFAEMHMEQVLYIKSHPFSARQLGEAVWTVSHQNIVEFLSGIDEKRQIRISYEQLVTDPSTIMESLCSQFGLPYESDLLAPYKNMANKAVDGIYAESRSMTDPHLLQQTSINPELANEDRYRDKTQQLSDVTLRLAARFDYGSQKTEDMHAKRRNAQRNLRRTRGLRK